MRRAVPHDSVVDGFFAGTSTLTQAQLDFLTKRQGVPNLSLAWDADGSGFCIGAADVVLGRRSFDFALPEEAEARSALVFVARDRSGSPADLVCWTPRDDRAMAHLGRVALLGEQDVFAPRLSEPLPVHRGVLGWLKAGRSGVVILNRRRAWHALEGVKIAAEDIEHGLELRSVLMPPAPSIVVPQNEARASG